VTTTHSESARQWIHIGSGCFALLLRYLTWWQAATAAGLAIFFNAIVLPRMGGQRLYRPEDRARGFPLGILLYPLAVLGLILVFPTRLDIAAAAWAILAVGDGAATLVGRRADSSGRTAKLPWNPEKTIAGTAAFMVCGAAAGVALAWWTRRPAPLSTFTVIAPILAAVAAAFVETLPVRLDDNISVPVVAAAVLWLSSLCSRAALESSHGALVAAAPWAIGVNAIVSWLGYRARTVTVSGMIGGAAVGVVIYACAGGAAWLFLFATFLLAALSSRLGLQRKASLGIDEEHGGRRGAGNAFGNCGIATVAAIAAVCTPYRAESLLAFVAALTAGGSDTVASEIGKAWGRAAFLTTSLRRVKPGTAGAMSLEGTAAGLGAALGLAALGAVLGLVPSTAIVTIVLAATAGALVESALGATLEGPGILNNDMLNFINTAVAAVLVVARYSVLVARFLGA
jgi:uncharacterized protein (TIGR00297 family)